MLESTFSLLVSCFTSRANHPLNTVIKGLYIWTFITLGNLRHIFHFLIYLVLLFCDTWALNFWPSAFLQVPVPVPDLETFSVSTFHFPPVKSRKFSVQVFGNPCSLGSTTILKFPKLCQRACEVQVWTKCWKFSWWGYIHSLRVEFHAEFRNSIVLNIRSL